MHPRLALYMVVEGLLSRKDFGWTRRQWKNHYERWKGY